MSRATTTVSEAGFRERVRAFLAEQLPGGWRGVGALEEPELSSFLQQWREALVASGFIAPDWPVEYGGAGLSERERIMLEEELAMAGAPSWALPTDPIGFALLGRILLHWGTADQKARFLPALVSGEHRWAQGFSEPEAGSDLFNLRTRAVLDGDEWLVHGHKTWQTQGCQANWIFLLARTDPDAPNRDALSFLLVPIDQPGVEVRPIRTITGDEEFAEVFLDGARAAAADVVGRPGQGAAVALSLLGFERSTVLGATHLHYEHELDRLVDMARARGRDRDPGVRQRLAWCRMKVDMMRMMALRAREQLADGTPPGPESSIFKLYETQFDLRLTDLAIDILGLDALVTEGPGSHTVLGPDLRGTPNTSAVWQKSYLRSRAAVIYGGSSQIQRTTLGERVLGLPPEPRGKAAGR